jgi:hypothetical protein
VPDRIHPQSRLSCGILKYQLQNRTFRKLDASVFLKGPEDGNKSSFRNVDILLIYNTGRWRKSINPVLLSVIQHRQNPSDPIIIYVDEHLEYRITQMKLFVH